MRPKKHETTGSNDLLRARLDQIINMQHELVQLAGKIDWDFIGCRYYFYLPLAFALFVTAPRLSENRV
jgi:hypothetical protein